MSRNAKLCQARGKETNKFRVKYDKLSLNEKIQYMNRNKSGNFSVDISNEEGTLNISERKPRIHNYFEIDF